jgi:hypothetical protein
MFSGNALKVRLLSDHGAREKRGMLSRPEIAYLLDHELRRLDPVPLVDIQTVRHANDTAVHAARLVKRNGIDVSISAERSDLQFEMRLPDRPLFDQLEVSAPQGFREACTPRTRVAQDSREFEIHGRRRQIAVGDQGTTEVRPRV